MDDENWWDPRTDVPLHEWRPSAFEMLPADMAQAHQVHDRIWVSTGLSHSYLITASEGPVIINTGMGFEAPVHKRNFDSVDDSPVAAVIFTQGHVDHVGGVDHLKDPDTIVIAQAGNAAHQRDDERIYSYRIDRSNFAFQRTVRDGALRILDEFGSLPDQAIPQPTLTFEDSLELTIGDLSLELISTPGGETTDSLVVWLPDERVALVGNLLSALPGHIPNLVTLRGDRHREALKFVDSVDRLRALRPEMLLPGHHGPIEGADYIAGELQRVRDATLWVHDQTVEAMNSGRTLWETMKSLELPAELQVGEGYGKVAWDVRAIWETYAGWFKHSSTTELYGSPRQNVDSEIVALAGGPEPVVARADELLAQGDPVGAIHLCDVVLTGEAGHRGAIAVSSEAHRRLSEDSTNFWLSCWLDNQVMELTARLKSEAPDA